MRTLSTIATFVLVASLAACGGGTAAQQPGNRDGTPAGGTTTVGSNPDTARTIARPSAVRDLPEVTLLAPAELGAGRAPTFSWGSLPGASSYRLVVLGPDAPRWAWTGPETSVRYGGTKGEDGPSLVAGSWWSVSALDEAGNVVALSPLRAISPGDDRGPLPAWASGAVVAPSSPAPVASAAPPAASGALSACGLATASELSTALGMTFKDGAPSGFAMASDDCTFPTTKSGDLNVDLAPASGYMPDLWSPDQRPIPGLGEDSFSAKTAMDTKVGFRRGDHAVLLTFSFGRVDLDQLIELARTIDARIQQAG
jgi:hypothetical protein